MYNSKRLLLLHYKIKNLIKTIQSIGGCTEHTYYIYQKLMIDYYYNTYNSIHCTQRFWKISPVICDSSIAAELTNYAREASQLIIYNRTDPALPEMMNKICPNYKNFL